MKEAGANFFDSAGPSLTDDFLFQMLCSMSFFPSLYFFFFLFQFYLILVPQHDLEKWTN